MRENPPLGQLIISTRHVFTMLVSLYEIPEAGARHAYTKGALSAGIQCRHPDNGTASVAFAVAVACLDWCDGARSYLAYCIN